MTKRHEGKAMKNNSFTKGAQNGSVFEIDSKAELDQPKRIAPDPCRPKFARDNIRPLYSGIPSPKKVMIPKNSEIPQRKRKIEQLFKPKTSSSFVPPNQQLMTKVRRKSMLCLLDSVDSTQCHDDKTTFDSHTSSVLLVDHVLMEEHVSIKRKSLNDMDHWNCPLAVLSPSVDIDESLNGSNPNTLKKLIPNKKPSSIRERDRSCHLNSPKSPQLSAWLLSCIGDLHQRKVIPVGPRFQADVPKWSATENKSILHVAYRNESNDSKWLGSQVWTIGIINKKTTEEIIGKGRKTSCSCAIPRSDDCIKHHISVERLALQHDIGIAFYSWKFDEMGEQVSNSWSSRDRIAFESLVKMRSLSNGGDFVKRFLKRFPNKSRKEIINYYFNVYIPHRLSIQTRMPSIKEVDSSDEDEAQDSMDIGIQKKSEKGKLKVHNRNGLKCYLRS